MQLAHMHTHLSAQRHRTGNGGFSLVELSVVIVIISIIAVMGLEMAATYMVRTAYQVTTEKIARIDQALANYVRVNGRLPCPSDRTAVPPAVAYGREMKTGINCTAGTLASLATTRFGDVPVRDLNLPLTYMLDGFGDRFTYVMTRDMAKTRTQDSLANYTLATDALQIRSGKIDVACTSGARCQDRGGAAYAVISHGKDKRGAITKTNTTAALVCTDSTANDGKIDTVNCRLGDGSFVTRNGSTVVSLASNIFYDSRYNAGKQEESYFDDIIKWRSKADL